VTISLSQVHSDPEINNQADEQTIGLSTGAIKSKTNVSALSALLTNEFSYRV
jgi:hypothetical protein